MNVWIDCYAPLVGRIFVGGFFLWNGIEAALNLPAAAEIFAQQGIGGAAYFAVLVVAIEVLCGIAIITGIYTRLATLLLIVYLLVRAAFLTNFGSDAELNLFVQNLGLIGGLLYISAYGAGTWSMDRRQ